MTLTNCMGEVMSKQYVECPHCNNPLVTCPECNKTFCHGEAAHCDQEKCIAVNAPLDCYGCGRIVCEDLSGVLDLDMNLKAYAR